MTEVAGPRRYRIQFEVGADRVGDLIGLLVKDVTALNTQPATADAHRISFACLYDQLGTIIPLVTSANVDRLIVRPDDEESKPFARGAADNRPLEVGHVQVRRFAPTHPKLKAGGHILEEANPYRKIIKQMLAGDRTVAHFTDIADAFAAAGLSAANASNVLNRMTQQGMLVRIHRGAYRLPTTEETADLLHRRAEQARGNQSPDHTGQG